MTIEQHYRKEAWQHYQSSAEVAGVEASRVSAWVWLTVAFTSLTLVGLVALLVERLPRFDSVVVDCSNTAWPGLGEPIGVWNAESLVARPPSSAETAPVDESRILSDIRSTCVAKNVSSVKVRILRHRQES